MSNNKNRLSADEITRKSREYTFFSWAVQSEVNPIPIERAEGVYFWDATGKRYIDFSAQLMNVNIGHQHPKVIDAIKMRPTHSNMIFPGPGIGGYCLPKDGGLGYWAYRHILGFEDGDTIFKITPTAININDTRALHVA